LLPPINTNTLNKRSEISVGLSKHITVGPRVWRIPFGIQLVPGGIMAIGLIWAKESPRYLAHAGKSEQALKNLAYYRGTTVESPYVRAEMAEIEAQLIEERESRAGLGWKEAFFGPGNFIRFVIAAVIFLLQQFSGQNSVSYYAPRIFASVRISNTFLYTRLINLAFRSGTRALRSLSSLRVCTELSSLSPPLFSSPSALSALDESGHFSPQLSAWVSSSTSSEPSRRPILPSPAAQLPLLPAPWPASSTSTSSSTHSVSVPFPGSTFPTSSQPVPVITVSPLLPPPNGCSTSPSPRSLPPW
jgi:hypothetical protein